MSPATLVVVVGVGVVLLLVALRLVFGAKNQEVLDRLKQEVSGGPRQVVLSPSEDPGEDSSLGGIAKTIGRRMGADEGETSRIKDKLTQAGYRQANAVEQFLGIRLLVLLAFMGMTIFMATKANMTTNMTIFVSLVLVAAGLLGPNAVLDGRIQERQKELGKMLPDAMDLIVICVEAGLSMDQAINRVGQEIAVSSPILSKELVQTALEIEAGVGRAESFRKLAARTGIEDLRILSAMIIQAEQFGTSVAKSLRLQSSTMRLKRTQKIEESAATIPSKMTIPMIICILPSMFSILLGPAIVRVYHLFTGK